MLIFRALALNALLLVTAACSSVLYYPSNRLFMDPTSQGFLPDEIEFRSEDGTRLFGWYFHSSHQPPKASFVFFHGNAQNISSHFTTLLWILEEGYDFFIFDYRGYGRSEGYPDPRGTLLDGRSALRMAAHHAPETPLVIFGQSLGGAIALRVAAELKGELPIRLVLADSTFASYREAGRAVASRSWLLWPFQWLAYAVLSDEHAPKDMISRISPVPLVVVHGTDDSAVPVELGRRVYALASDPKEYWEIEGGKHIDGLWRKTGGYRERLLEKLRQVLDHK